MAEPFDVVVVGGGTAGLVTASGCARLGRRVALIEREALGGDCLWTGCVPTKALVATAKLAHQMRTAGRWGLPAHHPEISPRSVMESMREARGITARHDAPEKFRGLGIDVIDGEAKLVSPREVTAGTRHLIAKDIVIATGSRTAVPPVEGLAETGFVDHASFLARDEFPRSVVVLGGGSIGIEFAQIFRRFGSEVTVVEMMDEILPREDAEVIRCVREILQSEGVSLRTGRKVTAVRAEGGRKIVQTEGRSGDAEAIAADEIFVAAGRRGNIEGIGLEEAGVTTERSYVVVDRYLQTSVPRIWACGDVHGGPQFTHVAAYEAVKLVRNMLFPGKSAVAYSDIPWALYTDPEVAHLGLTEREARDEHGSDVRTYTVELADVDRAVIERTTGGFVKLVCTRKGRILGAHIVGANASALISIIAGARKQGLKVGSLATLVSPYPSMADAIQKAASLHYQQLSESWIGAIGRRIAAWAQ